MQPLTQQGVRHDRNKEMGSPTQVQQTRLSVERMVFVWRAAVVDGARRGGAAMTNLEIVLTVLLVLYQAMLFSLIAIQRRANETVKNVLNFMLDEIREMK